MLQEYFISLLCRCVDGARVSGLNREVVAIDARHKRNKSAWAPHIDNTKDQIIKAMDICPKDKPILVLGAGPCLDLPLQALNDHPAGAVLIDAVRLPRMGTILKKYPNLRFWLVDVTGYLAQAADHPCAEIPSGDWGLIISCNLLSQLAHPFAHVPPLDDDDRQIWQKICAQHIAALREMDCPALVISDYQQVKTIDGEGTTTDATLPKGLFADEAATHWIWPVAPKGELNAKTEISLTVGVWWIIPANLSNPDL